MMMEGKIKCKKCNSEIDWYYHVPQNMNSPIFDVETAPEDKAKILRVIESKTDRGYSLLVKGLVECKECGEINDVEP